MPAPLESFQDRSFRFACDIVRLYVALRSMSAVPHHLALQILKAGTSIGAQLEEAKGAQTRADSASKYSIALKEARETRYWLRLVTATGLVSTETVASTLQECGELVAILTAARKKLQTPPAG